MDAATVRQLCESVETARANVAEGMFAMLKEHISLALNKRESASLLVLSSADVPGHVAARGPLRDYEVAVSLGAYGCDDPRDFPSDPSLCALGDAVASFMQCACSRIIYDFELSIEPQRGGATTIKNHLVARFRLAANDTGPWSGECWTREIRKHADLEFGHLRRPPISVERFCDTGYDVKDSDFGIELSLPTEAYLSPSSSSECEALAKKIYQAVAIVETGLVRRIEFRLFAYDFQRQVLVARANIVPSNL